MLSDITLGQYIPVDSLVHKIDPRLKLFSTIISIFLIFYASNYGSLFIMVGYVFLFMLLSKIKINQYFKSIKLILFLVLFSSFLNLFYSVGTSVFQFYFIKITREGINNSIFVALRLLCLILISCVLTYTTTQTDLTYAIEKLMKPLKIFKIDVSEIAMIMTIALRFIPTLLEQTDRIIDAQKSRGANFESKDIIKKSKAYLSILTPLFVTSFKRAYDLALAMECRCYSGSDKRTRMRVLYVKRIDILFVIFMFFLCLGVLFCNLKLQSVI